MNLDFRALRADEIDVRIGTVSAKGVTFLLYKNARVDMSILDETVGAMNWKREHLRDNANCIVSLWDEDKKQWVSKEDTGTESFTEAEKGLASDSFKRACTNWGIGRELYESPFIFVKTSTKKKENGRGYEMVNPWEFSGIHVKEIDYMELDKKRVVSKLVLSLPKCDVFSWQLGDAPASMKEELATDLERKTFMDLCKQFGVDYKVIGKRAGATSLKSMTKEQHGRALIILKEIEEGKQ